MNNFTNLNDRLHDTTLAERVYFFGVVEDNNDPMSLSRVRVRCFNFHPEDKSEVPTLDLPWATVLQPTTSSSISGIGSTIPMEKGTWVYGFFADGEDAQFPFVTHTVPTQHRPNSFDEVGGSGTDYNPANALGEGGTNTGANRPFHNERVEGGNFNPSADPQLSGTNNSENHTPGSLIASADVNTMLTLKDRNRWESLGLTTYSWRPAPNGYATKDGMGSLRFHYGTALAFEAVSRIIGRQQITSAYRTPAYNKRVGGAKRSQHVQGRAIDVGLSGERAYALIDAASKNGFVGFGFYNSFIHIDTGSGRVWWKTNRYNKARVMRILRNNGWFQGKKGLEGINVKKSNEEEDPNGTETGSLDQETLEQNSPASTQLSDADRDATIRTIYGEARGETAEGQMAVANVIRNRTNDPRWPNTATGVVRQGNGSQFNAWRPSDPNFNTIQGLSRDSQEYRNIGNIVDGVFSGRSGDNTGGSVNYYNPNTVRQPEWWNRSVNQAGGSISIGNHLFAGDPSKVTSSVQQPTRGFQDPSDSLPNNEYKGEPSTNMNARGFNRSGNQERIIRRDDGRLTGLPAAGDIGTFGEPELRAGPQYPYNHVISTRAGHMIEMDNTPDIERVNIEHASTSGIEMFANGDVSLRTKGNNHKMDYGDSYHGIGGKYFITSVNDMNIRSTADLTQQADGSLNLMIGNDGNLEVSGDYTISVGEDIKIKAGGSGKVFIEGESLEFLSRTNINIEAKDNINIKAGGELKTSSGGNTEIFAPEVYIDDFVKMAQGGASVIEEGADTSDVGDPPERKIIEKNNLRNAQNSGKKIITTEEVADHYANERSV